ncbi:helix-turn-helix transcriptional regulator [Streptomyces sp. NPDC094143]|uniref:helix-turn-helix domain-containing protein n=1 Tax=Streptomyces sp. NPDC094143 TaxID=3155310 RepID=UPI003326E776
MCRTHRCPWRPPRSYRAGAAAARSRWPTTSAPATALLERLRHQISTRGITLDELARITGFSKTRISALLRGIEYYPSWELTYSVIHALGLPPWPLCRLWTAGAYEAAKSTTWITQRIAAVRPLGPEERPVEHHGFIEQMEHYYTAYARALLHIERPERIVAEAFDILWAGWDEAEAAAGPNLPRYAWRLLRSRVMCSASDGTPTGAPTCARPRS